MIDAVRQVVMLTPSRGLGGGIERYVETLEWAFSREGIDCRRIDLRGSGPVAHAQMLHDARELVRSTAVPTRLVLAHRALLPVGSLLAMERRARGMSLLCHGSDVWGATRRLRWQLERHLMGRSAVRVVAVSSFTAGALSEDCRATVLPPGLSREWFDALVKASTVVAPQRQGLHLVTAFRLSEWQDKGLPQLLDAVTALSRSDIRVTVCGSGDPPDDLLRALRGHRFCRLQVGLADSELADLYAEADLFVLATRTRTGRRPSGEGFGLVLLEAQVAGTPVIAPAFGGSHDAFVDRVTGIAPTDESAASLARALDGVLRDPADLAKMGARAAKWARQSFEPQRYALRVVERLL